MPPFGGAAGSMQMARMVVTFSPQLAWFSSLTIPSSTGLPESPGQWSYQQHSDKADLPLPS